MENEHQNPLNLSKILAPFCVVLFHNIIWVHTPGIFGVLSGLLYVCNLMKSVMKKPPWQGQMAFRHHHSNLIDSQVLTQPRLDWFTCCEIITEPCNCKTHQMVSIPAFLQHLPQHLAAPQIKGDIWHVWVWKMEGIYLCDYLSLHPKRWPRNNPRSSC
jgi:hypothetical protein